MVCNFIFDCVTVKTENRIPQDFYWSNSFFDKTNARVMSVITFPSPSKEENEEEDYLISIPYK